ncbi:MAG: helix-turn-helix domain-containing protein [Pseudomonadota bacterium]
MNTTLDQPRRTTAPSVPPVPQALWREYPDLVIRSRDTAPPCPNNNSDTARLVSRMVARRRVRQGEGLYREGEHFQYLHAVQSGSFKSTLALPDGGEQVSNFYMTGELLGLDGVAECRHASSATALEDSEISTLSHANLNELCAITGGVQGCVMRLISREIVRGNGHVLLLGSLNSTQRVAAFLLNQSQRLSARGYSAVEFHLKMTRGEIGSFLGMTLETVSRTFTELQQQRLLTVERRHITITSLDGLARI